MTTDAMAAQGRTASAAHVQIASDGPGRIYVGESRHNPAQPTKGLPEMTTARATDPALEAPDPDAPIPCTLTPAAEAYLEAQEARAEAEAEAGL